MKSFKKLKFNIRKWYHESRPCWEGDSYYDGLNEEKETSLSNLLYDAFYNGELNLLNTNDRGEIQYSLGGLLVTLKKNGQIVRWSDATGKTYNYEWLARDSCKFYLTRAAHYVIVNFALRQRRAYELAQQQSKIGGYTIDNR